MVDRNLLANVDWMLIVLLLLNSAIGVIFIYSASHYSPGNFYVKQIIWIFLSLIVLFLLLFVDYKILVAYSIYFYFVIICVLVGVLVFGRFLSGAKSWIVLPFFHAQPSEITKIVLILLLASIFSEFKMKYLSLGKGMISSGIAVLPFFLVALQPDLGTAVSYIPILLASIFLAGLDKKTVVFFLIISLALGFFAWNFVLKDYQKKRLTTLIFPGQDPLGSSYHVTQSKIAVGSGGLLGKGYKKGTQSQLKFLPARHTDFIFSVIGEEVGFMGVAMAMAFYFLLLLRLFKSVGQSRDRTGVYIVFMVAVMITFQFMVNAMMVIGLFPVTGIPLPLYSYGGSSLLTNYLGISLVLNVKMRRFVNV